MPEESAQGDRGQSAAFLRLAKPIQRALERMGWRELRPIQVDAIHRILDSSEDVIISASTASGKTEAAFLPILSEIAANSLPSVQAIYVGPLKALINDQFRRVEELCQYAEVTVHRWHGDVGKSQKASMVSKPSGVLLITPESIESLMLNRTGQLSRVFASLRHIVIDEFHSFVGRERGTHLRSLIARLRSYSKTPIQTIALSATLGDHLELFQRWLQSDQPDSVSVLFGDSSGSEIAYRIHTYEELAITVDDDDGDDDGQEMPEAAEAIASSTANEDLGSAQEKYSEFERDVFRHFAGKRGLIFSNKKDEIETLADSLNTRCEREKISSGFLVHHGSLSKEIREDTESLMRESRPMTTICSPTLEMGIDIGALELVGQLGPASSVATLVQRLGRSGRKETETRQMRVYSRVRPPGKSSSLIDYLHIEHLQCIAMTELMLAKWLEPPRIAAMDLSTLLHQVLSVLGETGGLRADRIFERLIQNGGFRGISQRIFAKLLRDAAAKDLIEQEKNGDVILGLLGERIVRSYDFYSAFQAPEEFNVLNQGREIGTLPAVTLPQTDQHFLLAGRRWRVNFVDLERKTIVVEVARGKKKPIFVGGSGEIHARIREEMRKILTATVNYRYLDQRGAEYLEMARHSAMQANLIAEPLFAVSRDSTLWFTWTGTIEQRTLLAICAAAELECADEIVAIEFKMSKERTLEAIDSLRKNLPAKGDIAAKVTPRQRRKFDGFLSDALLIEGIAEEAIDIRAAKKLLGIKNEGTSEEPTANSET